MVWYLGLPITSPRETGEMGGGAGNRLWGQETWGLWVLVLVLPPSFPSWPQFAPLLNEGLKHMVSLLDHKALPSSEIPGFGEILQ